MNDEFEGFAPSLTTPATKAESVSPDDLNDLSQVTRALYVGGAGDIRVVLVSGDTITIRNASAGVIYPLRVKRVLSTGTVATDIVGLR